MNRRNALLGIGAIATGGGALFGSGAFSTVQADRSVSLTSTGDASANLELNATNTRVATTASNGELEISASSFNVDSTTVFEGAITIFNNGNDTVNVAATAITSGTNFDSVSLVAYDAQNDNLGGNDFDLSSDAIPLSSGGDLIVGLQAVAANSSTGTDTDTITIEASSDGTFETSGLSPNIYGTTET